MMNTLLSSVTRIAQETPTAGCDVSSGASDILGLFQGLNTMITQFTEGDWNIAFGRIFLILLGCVMIWMGKKGVLEALLMIPMGLGMIAVNAGMLMLKGPDFNKMTGEAVDLMSNPSTERITTLFVESTLSTETIAGTNAMMNWLQIDCLQPIYTFTFSNGLIACFIFMGIGALLDVGYILARPFQSMFLAMFAEMGTILTLPIALLFGYSIPESAAIAMVGGADGPMVIFTSLMLAPDLFVPITVVAYLYLGLCYGGYPYLLKMLIPERIRGMAPVQDVEIELDASEKLAFAVIANIVLCFLFPVAAPLLVSLFLGISVREAGLKDFASLVSNQVLYFATLMLGFILGILCDARTMLDPKVFGLLALGILSLLISGLGGILGGYILYFATGGKFNPTIGIAGVSCVPTNSKVAQKSVQAVSPGVVVMPNALGANISGVITSAIICGIYITMFQDMAGVISKVEKMAPKGQTISVQTLQYIGNLGYAEKTGKLKKQPQACCEGCSAHPVKK